MWKRKKSVEKPVVSQRRKKGVESEKNGSTQNRTGVLRTRISYAAPTPWNRSGKSTGSGCHCSRSQKCQGKVSECDVESQKDKWNRKEKRRTRPELNRWPRELQSLALPLSYESLQAFGVRRGNDPEKKEVARKLKSGSTRVRTGDPHYVKVMW